MFIILLDIMSSKGCVYNLTPFEDSYNSIPKIIDV